MKSFFKKVFNYLTFGVFNKKNTSDITKVSPNKINFNKEITEKLQNIKKNESILDTTIETKEENIENKTSIDNNEEKKKNTYKGYDLKTHSNKIKNLSPDKKKQLLAKKKAAEHKRLQSNKGGGMSI